MTHLQPKLSLSAMLTSLPLEFAAALCQVRDLGFSHVDLVGMVDRPDAHREALADSGLLVSCAAIGRDLPADVTLDAAETARRRAAVDLSKRQIADAAQLGARHCYLVSGRDSSANALARFTEACCHLADYAGRHMVRLCVEHNPGRALPSAALVLAWLGQVRHDNLALLLDVGHCSISGEDRSAVIREAGPRLGYVHFDDNDGQSDLHLPLLAGRLTEDALAATLVALRECAYEGCLALELNPNNPDPVHALRDGKAILERLGREA